MKRTLLVTILLFLLLPSNAQPLGWNWAWAAGGAQDDHARARVSPAGAAYLLGTYEGTMDAHGTSVISSGQADIFVQQLDPADGSVLWTAEAHNTAQMEVMDMTFRSNGELVVTGYVYHDGNDASFGPFTLSGQSFGHQAFVAGLSPTGTWTWLSAVGSPTVQSSQGWLVRVDGNDDIMLHCGIQRVWVHKFTGNGMPVWSASGSADQGSVDGYAMDVTTDNGLVITGRFYSTATFGTTQLTDATIYYDIFIAKLNTDGEWEWAVQAGGSHWDKGFGVCGAPNGDVFVMGTYRNLATFGPNTIQGSGLSDLWTARLTSDGQWLWVNPAGTSAGMEIYDMALSAAGDRLVCTGSYAFNGTTLDGQTLPAPPNNSNQAYVAELDILGNFISARGFGSLAGDQGEAVAYTSDGDILVAGNFGEDMVLDGIALPNNLNSDLWVGRLDQGLTTPVPSLAPQSGGPRLELTDLGPMVLNPAGNKGLLLFFDPLGRTLGSERLTGAAHQPVVAPISPGLLCWRITTLEGQHRASGIISAASVR